MSSRTKSLGYAYGLLACLAAVGLTSAIAMSASTGKRSLKQDKAPPTSVVEHPETVVEGAVDAAPSVEPVVPAVQVSAPVEPSGQGGATPPAPQGGGSPFRPNFVDCNTNGTDDPIDITPNATSADCNTNGIPDECDVAHVDIVSALDTPVTIPDNLPAGGSSTLTASRVATVADVNVRLTITHTYDSDLDLTLSHGATTIVLASAAGGSGDHFTSTVFDDEASISISGTGASAPFTGTFIPDQALSAFDGSAENGTWSLKAVDNFAGDSGTILSWSVIVTTTGLADCNTNVIPDVCEIGGNDCNTNTTLDVCELPGNDCNTNLVLDRCDIRFGGAPDCNTNNRPDVCDSDCNTNNTADACESGGCNTNGTPDICEPDCNTNGTPEGCENLTGRDCNNNGVPDECDRAGQLLANAPAGPSLFLALPVTETFTTSDYRSVSRTDDFALASATTINALDVEGQFGSDEPVNAGDSFSVRFWSNNLLNVPASGVFQYYPENLEYLENVPAARVTRQAHTNDPGPGITLLRKFRWHIVLGRGVRLSAGSHWIQVFYTGPASTNWTWNINATAFGEPLIDTSITSGSTLVGDRMFPRINPDLFLAASGVPSLRVRFYAGSSNINGNGVCDECEDGNSNGTPDYLEALADCNSNGIGDVVEQAFIPKTDCNTDGVPDECQNYDCNTNRTLDICEVLATPAIDCNGNKLIDLCEARGVTIQAYNQLGGSQRFGLFDDPTRGVNTGFVVSDDFVVTTTTRITGVQKDMRFNINNNVAGQPDEFMFRIWTHDAVNNKPLAIVKSEIIPAARINRRNYTGSTTHFRYEMRLKTPVTLAPGTYWLECTYTGTRGNDGLAGGGNGVRLGTPSHTSTVFPGEVWTPNTDNFHIQWILYSGGDDCNTNDTLDGCEVGGDSNANGTPDACEDCNTNGTVDFLEVSYRDCNTNTVADQCDIGFLTESSDCNTDGTPDECQIDCNTNGTHDRCDTVSHTSADCDTNFVPDECEADCNTNFRPDICDVRNGTGDCNNNDTPDPCEPGDCNTNGQVDACEITLPTAVDCNTNGLIDVCDTDCNTNGVVDACQPGFADCNANGIPDLCENTTATVGANMSGQARLITSGVVYSGDISLPGVYSIGDNGCADSLNHPSLYYKYVPKTSGSLILTMCGSPAPYDASLSVHSGSPATDGNRLRCSDDGCSASAGIPSRIPSLNAGDTDPGTPFLVTAGTPYWIRVTGWNGQVGAYQLVLIGPAADGDNNGNNIPDSCECTCSGDINSSGNVDGTDIAGYVRCLLGAGGGGDNCACQTNITQAAFIAKLLSPGSNCP